MLTLLNGNDTSHIVQHSIVKDIYDYICVYTYFCCWIILQTSTIFIRRGEIVTVKMVLLIWEKKIYVVYVCGDLLIVYHRNIGIFYCWEKKRIDNLH